MDGVVSVMLFEERVTDYLRVRSGNSHRCGEVGHFSQVTNCAWFWPEDVEDKKTSKSLVLFSNGSVKKESVTMNCTTGKICSWWPIKQFDDCERSSLTFVLSRISF